MKARKDLTIVGEDYLRAIYSAAEWDEDGIGVSDLAHLMGVVPSTASENVRRLREAGLVDHQPYQRVRLTEEGRAEAVRMVRRHRILETFLYRYLGFSWDEIHEEAEELEHAVSDRFIDRIDKALGYPALDPHGDPIPAADGSLLEPKPVSLEEVEVGTRYQIARIRDAEPAVLRYFESRGLVPSAWVTVVERIADTGIVTVEVDGKQLDLAEHLAASVRVVSRDK
ncbi:MAG: metal-dependent transcriptional regulator [Actinomycetaceae bacterium]|nr:metal-dependent transcriptional regulator [Actinomycetaceae bacterium]